MKASRKSSQTGIALVTVLLILVFLSVYTIIQAENQNIEIHRVSNLIESEQAFQIAVGGEQWATKLLEQDMDADAESASGLPVDHAGESWANLGPAVKVEGTESYMQVAIVDLHARFNVNNLIQGINANPTPGTEGASILGGDSDSVDNAATDEESDDVEGSQNSEGNDSGNDSEINDNGDGQNGRPRQSWYALFQTLLLNLELDPALADALVDWIDEDDSVTGTDGAEDDYYQSLDPPYLPANRPLVSIGELASVRGFTPSVIRELLPHITALPVDEEDGFTRINMNTASATLLSVLASETGMSPELFLPVIESRVQRPFETVSDFTSQYNSTSIARLREGVEEMLDVRGEYFLNISCALNGKVQLSQFSTLHKDPERNHVTVINRLRRPDCPIWSLPGPDSPDESDQT